MDFVGQMSFPHDDDSITGRLLPSVTRAKEMGVRLGAFTLTVNNPVPGSVSISSSQCSSHQIMSDFDPSPAHS